MLTPDSSSAILIGTGLAVATFGSEDLACIGAGTLVAAGQIGLATAVIGCFTGILIGDLLLFLAGRQLGRRALATRFVGRLVSREALAHANTWLRRRGPAVILTTRFVPGTRVATYLAAGALQADARPFVLWFTIAAALWTPLLVGSATLLGASLVEAALASGRSMLTWLVASLALVGFALRLVPLIVCWRGRRLLLGFWRRLTRWEFWPPWIFYPPVLGYLACLMIKHRSATMFTAANPGIAGGGFIGESKIAILRALSGFGETVARAVFLPGDRPLEARIDTAQRFMRHARLTFPIVLKPDQGQRGSGVMIVRSEQDLRRHLGASPVDLIVQEYVDGFEFGVFYYRHPSDSHGRIFSMTEKRFPAVIGDGRRTLDELILADDRAVCLAHVHRRVHRARLGEVPAVGTRVPLVEVGSHCRGSVFADATRIVTPELEAAFDEVAKRFDGFYFGRFDVRTPSVEEFVHGANFRIVELNGVTSEATHIYDAANGVVAAWRVLFAQWRLAFDIGAGNHRRGVAPAAVRALLGQVREYRRVARLHPQQLAS